MDAERTLRNQVADITGFVSLAPRGEQFARELVMYKDERVSELHRNRMVSGLAAVLWKWLGRHERCLGAPLGIDRFDVITTVPSTSGRGDHPLRRVVAGIVTGSADRHEDLLIINRTDLDQRAQASDRYRASRNLHGAQVLVVDDTWTTGAHAQSASAAPKAARASRVGVLVLGRWLNLDTQTTPPNGLPNTASLGGTGIDALSTDAPAVRG
jgi:hypothetical protein